ncbi:ABC-type transport system involved in multi-copper enzyme maturation, permease component [Halorubrum saccharovorum]|uniref:ABC-type transport system involved in multi-copper enzyme maturation, permease component n=1 Tax=Halorubrum saccharovorum TaxID=2248 RepID=A0A081ETE8_9EURY|nr:MULTISPECIES: ABC transporter permease subunit [Halorubrum]KDS90686.1 ABC-type transport system involved in multi-copper enzyme maturation, permease component [Halorubrum saccharovorum]
MFETVRYEGKRRIRGAAVLTAGIGAYAGFIIWYFTVLEDVDYEEVFNDLPPAMLEAFGIESLSTIEGFLGAQVFNFVWLLGLGLYFAYVGGGIVASDIETGRMDIFLSLPVTRARLLVEKFGALLVPMLAVNALGGPIIYLFVVAVGETIPLDHLLLAHLLSIPFLLVCAGIGLVFSVAVDRAAIAERGAVGTVFVLYLLESVVGGAEAYDWIQYLSPTQYYEPTPVLIDGSFEPIDSAILLVAFAGLLMLSQALFECRDV